jgi:hypothetical protein
MLHIVNQNFQARIGMEQPVSVHHSIQIVVTISVNTINTVGMVNVIMVKLLKPVHKSVKNDAAMVYAVLWNTAIIVLEIVASAPKCLGVEILCVMETKIVAHVLVIVGIVLPQNIVGIIFVIMAKHAIHVEQTVIRALMCVGMVNAQARRIVCHVLGIVDHVHLLRSVAMDFVIVCMNHVHLVSKIVAHVIILVEMESVIL